jgi:hypothetical protein
MKELTTMLTPALQSGYTDSQGFTYEPCMGEGVSEFTEFLDYCRSVTQEQRNKIIAVLSEEMNAA